MTAPASASAEPQTINGRTPMRSINAPARNAATHATAASTLRACPIALTDASRSRLTATTIGVRTTMLDWVAVVARTSGRSRRPRVPLNASSTRLERGLPTREVVVQVVEIADRRQGARSSVGVGCRSGARGGGTARERDDRLQARQRGLGDER